MIHEPQGAAEALRSLIITASIDVLGARYSPAVAFGPPVVVKYLTPHSDWQARATDDSGREAGLYLDGTMDKLPKALSHAVLAAEPYGQGWQLSPATCATCSCHARPAGVHFGGTSPHSTTFTSLSPTSPPAHRWRPWPSAEGCGGQRRSVRNTKTATPNRKKLRGDGTSSPRWYRPTWSR